MTGWIWCLNRACFTGSRRAGDSVECESLISEISGRSDPGNFTG